jgi:alpha-beta hydrolase superfamily lysophospholipase
MYKKITAIVFALCITGGCAKFGTDRKIEFNTSSKAKPVLTLTENLDKPQSGTIEIVTPDAYVLAGRYFGEQNNPKVILLMAHGFGAYSTVFESFAKDFFALKEKRGDALSTLVIAYDQRGHGYSGNAENAGLMPTEDVLVSDFRQTVALIKQRYPDVPLHVFGQSMGSAVAVLSLVGHESGVASLFISPPAWQNTQDSSARVKRAVKALDSTFLRLKHYPACRIMSAKNINESVADKEYIIVGQKDPLQSFSYAPRIDYTKRAMDLSAKAAKQVTQLQLPVFVTYGNHDGLADAQTVKNVWLRVHQQPNITFKCYEKGKHILYQTRETRQEFLGDVLVRLQSNTNPKLLKGAFEKDLETCLDEGIVQSKKEDNQEEDLSKGIHFIVGNLEKECL